MNWIGQDFSSKIKLNLLPGFRLQAGYWQVQIQYLSDSDDKTMYHNQTFMCGNRDTDLDAIVGKDVKGISVTIYRHNSFPGSHSGVINKDLSIHKLIMLNFAFKLIGSRISSTNT